MALPSALLTRRAFLGTTSLSATGALLAAGDLQVPRGDVAVELDPRQPGAGTVRTKSPFGIGFGEGWPVSTVGPDDDLAARIGPRRIIELRPGRYTRGLVLRGIEDLVIRAQLDSQAEVCFWRCGIRLESATRVGIEGVVFRQSPATALGVEGPSREIQVDQCSFFACGMPEGSVTFWLGRNTALCRVHACLFDACGLRAPRHDSSGHVSDIAVMCAEESCIEHLFMNNRVLSYGYGFQLGISGTCRKEGRHRVEGNQIYHPLSDGIHVKQAHCLVRGNRVHGAARYAISTRAGFETRLEANHLTDCQHGIRILGPDHQVVGNLIERSRRYGLLLSPGKAGGDGFPAENTLVEDNVFRDCGGFDQQPIVPPPGAVILSDATTEQRIRNNRFEGIAVERAVLPSGWSD